MGYLPEPPAAIRKTAERDTWYTREGAERLLDWIDESNLTLLGIEAARKLSDGQWALLLSPMLSAVGDRGVSIDDARHFLAENDDPDLMFEPVW